MAAVNRSVEIKLPSTYEDVMSRTNFIDRIPSKKGDDIYVTCNSNDAAMTDNHDLDNMKFDTIMKHCTDFWSELSNNPRNMNIVTALEPPLVAGAMMEYFKSICLLKSHYSDADSSAKSNVGRQQRLDFIRDALHEIKVTLQLHKPSSGCTDCEISRRGARKAIAESGTLEPTIRESMPLVDFYLDKTQSSPDGDRLTNIHSKWYHDYDRLESHHGYIQWLFPLFERGMNKEAPIMNIAELSIFRKDKTIQGRIVDSYKMMLHFYGFELKSLDTGEVVPLPDAVLRSKRFRNLQNRAHNYLRITRILTFLGLTGFERFQAPFVIALLTEICNGNISNAFSSCTGYWVGTILDDEEREAVTSWIQKAVRGSNAARSVRHRVSFAPGDDEIREFQQELHEMDVAYRLKFVARDADHPLHKRWKDEYMKDDDPQGIFLPDSD